MLALTCPDDTHRIGNVNTLGIAARHIVGRMTVSIAERLREARLRAGYETAQAAADAFGWKIPAYRHHENGTRAFDKEAARRYARAFKVSASWLLGIDASAVGAEPVLLPVSGKVAAGVWTDPVEQEDDGRRIMVPPSPIPGARRFLLETQGLSMDREYPPGTILDCISIFDLGIEPQTGDDVIVERTREDGRRECTVKRYHRTDDGEGWLMPQSTQPEFQEPIIVGRAGDGADSAVTVQITGFVIGSYSPRQINLFDRVFGS